MAFTRLPLWITPRLPERLMDGAIYKLVGEAVCGAEAEKGLRGIAEKYGLPLDDESDWKKLKERFQYFGGLLERSDYRKRAWRYLMMHPNADVSELQRNLFRGPERREIGGLCNPYRWYWRRVQAFRKKRAGK